MEKQPGGVRERLEKLKDNLVTQEEGFGSLVQIRSVIGMIALAGILLPWMRIDGYGNAMSGAELIGYAFTGTDRGSMFGTSVPGALAVLFIPGVASACCVYGFFKTINGQYSPKAYPCGALLLLGMLLLSGSVASSDGLAVAGIPIPGWGLLVTMLAQGILFIHGMLENNG